MRKDVNFDTPKKTKPLLTWRLQGFIRFDIESCDPAGIRTQDHYIKSVMLYQLSYGIIPFFVGIAKVEIKCSYTNNYKIKKLINIQ